MWAMPPSTHIDENGKVITVIDDGDNSVYQHGKNADGTINNNIGKTIGTVKKVNNSPFHFGSDALRIWGIGGTPKI
ncbi:hypothetical protein GCM10022216_23980 [Sphingobacterium kyonggiense]|uniref:Uncharacterized protein n=2 Tax=Sphingobacterium kyonggiense TaxID=714075 RepID=A0ABP7YXB1_9SPHI